MNSRILRKSRLSIGLLLRKPKNHISCGSGKLQFEGRRLADAIISGTRNAFEMLRMSDAPLTTERGLAINRAIAYLI
jgi:hypothetical protein